MAEEREKLYNTYYKDTSVPLMSGIPLPKGEDGKVHDKEFIDCSFHVNCENVEFVNCTFTDCYGAENLGKRGQ